MARHADRHQGQQRQGAGDFQEPRGQETMVIESIPHEPQNDEPDTGKQQIPFEEIILAACQDLGPDETGAEIIDDTNGNQEQDQRQDRLPRIGPKQEFLSHCRPSSAGAGGRESRGGRVSTPCPDAAVKTAAQ